MLGLLLFSCLWWKNTKSVIWTNCIIKNNSNKIQLMMLQKTEPPDSGTVFFPPDYFIIFHYSTTSAWMFTHLWVYICGTVISALIQSFVVHYVVIICALTRSPVLQHSKLLKSLLWKLSSSLPTHLFSFTPVSLNILIDLHMKSSFPKRDKCQIKKNWVRHAILLCTEPIHCSINVSCQIAIFPCLKCTSLSWPHKRRSSDWR